MRQYTRFVFAYYLRPFIMCLVILVFMLTLRFMAMYIENLMGKSIDGGIIAQLFMHASLRMAILALPLAILSASLISFGNMGEYYELSALKSCGVGLVSFIRPLVLFAVILTAISLWLAFDVVPNSNREIISLIYDATQTKSSVAIRPGHFYKDIDGYVIRVAKKDEKSGMLYDMLIYDFTENPEQPKMLVADSARTKLVENGAYLEMNLYHGARHEEMGSGFTEKKSNGLGRLYFDSLRFRFDLSAFAFSRSDSRFQHRSIFPRKALLGAIDSMERRLKIKETLMHKALSKELNWDTTDVKPDEERLDTFQIDSSFLAGIPKSYRLNSLEMAVEDARNIKEQAAEWSKNIEKERQQIREYKHEYYNRIAIPIACIIFMLVGASFGAIIRKGGIGAPAVAALGFFSLFYGLMSQGWKMAKYGWSEPWVGAFLPVLVFIPIATYVTYQAANDSPLFDANSWNMRLDKIKEALKVRKFRV